MAMSWSSFAFLALSKVTSHPPPAVEGITLEADGFRYQPAGGAPCVIRWNEVERVSTYCVTLFSHEALCLDFEANGSRLSLNEEQPGFEAMREAFFQALALPPAARTDPVAGEIKVVYARG